jgi:hypothetical protein
MRASASSCALMAAGLPHRQREIMLALLVAGAVIQRQALQPGAVDTADVTGASTKIAQGLLELLNAHETAGQ